MLKKIISLMLVVCMMATMAISVSADPAESAVSAVISEVAQDGTFTVTFYVTPNAEAEIQGYTLKVDFDKTQIAVDSTWKTKEVFGELYGDVKQYNNKSDSFVKAVWSYTEGMLNEDGDKIVADETGNIPVCVFKLKVVEDEANYGKEATLTYTVDTALLSDGNVGIANVPTTGSFEMPDNRPEMEGLSFEDKEVVYNGEAVAYPVVTGAPAEAVTKYTVDGVENAEIKDAGTYKVVATTTCAGYKKNVSEATVTVKKASATLTIKDASKEYGASEPTVFDATEEGLFGNDTLNYTLERAAGEDVGTYAIKATLGENKNYEVKVVDGTFTISKKAAELVIENASKVYGEAEPTVFKANATGLVGEDRLNYTLERAAGEDVGKYAITATLGENKNYDVTVVDGEFEIKKADYTGVAVEVAKNVMINKAKSYAVDMTSALANIKGAKVIAAELAEVNENISNVTVDGNVVKFDVASYAEEKADFASINVGVESDNYNNFKAVIKIATVDKEELTISGVEVASKTYDGAAVVVDKAELSVEGATEVAFDKETLEYKFVGVEGTEYDSTEAPKAAGKYNLVVSVPEENENYSGSKVVTFEIAKKEAKILIDNKDKKVKAANPEFTFKTEDFVDGEAPASINFADIAVDSLAGEYDITAEYADPNYNITIVKGKLTISKYTLKVTAPSKNVFVGGTLDISTLAATIENEDKEEALVATVKVYDGDAVVTAIDTTAEKSYVTKATIEGLDTDKYDVTYVDGAVVVKKAGGRPSNTGIIKPATGGSGGGGSTSKPADKEEDKKDDKEEDKEDKEDSKPAASANIAIKEDAKEVNFVVADAENKFNPDVNASRNDVVAVLSAIFNVTDVKNAPEFTDSADEAVKALAAAGVINGYEDGSFQGEKDITRAEFVKLLAAALKLEAVEGAEATLTDIADHWAAEWVKTFVAKGYIVGYPDGTFRPEANITKAEMVVVATRVAGSVAGEGAVEFADVDASHWAYDFIMKAAK